MEANPADCQKHSPEEAYKASRENPFPRPDSEQLEYWSTIMVCLLPFWVRVSAVLRRAFPIRISALLFYSNWKWRVLYGVDKQTMSTVVVPFTIGGYAL